VGKLRANKYKCKKRSCSLCKPHKMKHERNRKTKEFALLKRIENELKQAS